MIRSLRGDNLLIGRQVRQFIAHDQLSVSILQQDIARRNESKAAAASAVERLAAAEIHNNRMSEVIHLERATDAGASGHRHHPAAARYHRHHPTAARYHRHHPAAARYHRHHPATARYHRHFASTTRRHHSTTAGYRHHPAAADHRHHSTTAGHSCGGIQVGRIDNLVGKIGHLSANDVELVVRLDTMFLRPLGHQDSTDGIARRLRGHGNRQDAGGVRHGDRHRRIAFVRPLRLQIFFVGQFGILQPCRFYAEHFVIGVFQHS